MRNPISTALIAAGLCLSSPAFAATATLAQSNAVQDKDYQALLRCYGFHSFKIELGTVIKDNEILESGKNQLELDTGALRKYGEQKKISWDKIKAAADAEAASRKVLYTGDDKDARMKALMDDQEFCSSDAFVDVIFRYQ